MRMTTAIVMNKTENMGLVLRQNIFVLSFYHIFITHEIRYEYGGIPPLISGSPEARLCVISPFVVLTSRYSEVQFH